MLPTRLAILPKGVLLVENANMFEMFYKTYMTP